MRMAFKASRTEIAAERQRRYLEQWPLERQAEAVQDALTGRPEKLAQMQEAFNRIKRELPYPEQPNGE